jgi:(1->4)-alpha-D-glucan 1-alpha-D-glucosylmutase
LGPDWDLSLVDPDNRTPVDFAARVHSLDAALPCDLAPDWADGRIKQALIGRTLALRKRAPRLFSEGAYEPLDSVGPKAAHVLAFARLLDEQIAITIACRRPFHLLAPGLLATVADDWNGTRIALPAKWAGAGTVDALSGQTFSNERELDVERVLARLPVALLTNVGH